MNSPLCHGKLLSSQIIYIFLSNGIPCPEGGVPPASHFLYQNKISLSRSRLEPVVPGGTVPQINFEFFQSTEMLTVFL